MSTETGSGGGIVKALLMGGSQDGKVLPMRHAAPTIRLAIQVPFWDVVAVSHQMPKFETYERGVLRDKAGKEHYIYTLVGDDDKRCPVHRLLDQYFGQGAST
jgi:hypothetical protein